MQTGEKGGGIRKKMGRRGQGEGGGGDRKDLDCGWAKFNNQTVSNTEKTCLSDQYREGVVVTLFTPPRSGLKGGGFDW